MSSKHALGASSEADLRPTWLFTAPLTLGRVFGMRTSRLRFNDICVSASSLPCCPLERLRHADARGVGALSSAKWQFALGVAAGPLCWALARAPVQVGAVHADVCLSSEGEQCDLQLSNANRCPFDMELALASHPWRFATPKAAPCSGPKSSCSHPDPRRLRCVEKSGPDGIGRGDSKIPPLFIPPQPDVTGPVAQRVGSRVTLWVDLNIGGATKKQRSRLSSRPFALVLWPTQSLGVNTSRVQICGRLHRRWKEESPRCGRKVTRAANRRAPAPSS
ncbi:hypothetical protein L1887_48621 [Cichorium endivia]|nr:hypothetical protein L1887_48621 [Cichorium endivia]